MAPSLVIIRSTPATAKYRGVSMGPAVHRDGFLERQQVTDVVTVVAARQVIARASRGAGGHTQFVDPDPRQRHGGIAMKDSVTTTPIANPRIAPKIAAIRP